MEGSTDGLKQDRERMEGFRKLDKKETELRNRWWVDGETDPKLLDQWLVAKIDLYQYRLQNNMFDPRSRNQREQVGEKLLLHQKLLRGSYHREKADYCLEIAQSFRLDAGDAEKKLKQSPEKEDEEDIREDLQLDEELRNEQEMYREKDIQLNKDLITTSSRKIAANCLEMAANSLRIPETDQESPSSNQ